VFLVRILRKKPEKTPESLTQIVLLKIIRRSTEPRLYVLFKYLMSQSSMNLEQQMVVLTSTLMILRFPETGLKKVERF